MRSTLFRLRGRRQCPQSTNQRVEPLFGFTMIGLWISGCDAGAPIAAIDRRETEFIGNAFAAAEETPAPDGVLWHVGKNDRTHGQRRDIIEIAAREPLHDQIGSE